MASKTTRDDLLALLSCMGVKIPKESKILEEVLKRRLGQTFDAAQRYDDLVGKSSFNPSDYPSWSSTDALIDAVARTSLSETIFPPVDAHGRIRPSSTQEDTFKEVRQVFLGFGHHYERGHNVFALTDNKAEWGVGVKIIDVIGMQKHEDKDKNKVPVFCLLYGILQQSKARNLYERVADVFGVNETVKVSTTEMERKIVLELFRHNSKRVSAEYRPPRSPSEDACRLTFILPLAPLNMRDLGKLNNDPGCDVCGKANTFRCAQCFQAAYCGKDCQRQDWPSHKQTCKSLKGGTWHTLTFTNYGAGRVFRSVINRHDTTQEAMSQIERIDLNEAPPNIHGNKVFLVKFQVPLMSFGDSGSMLLYDRQKSFQATWSRGSNRETYAAALRVVGDRLKIYRWAQRVGDFELSVCFDRCPAQDPVW